jgi:hypothetical protein
MVYEKVYVGGLPMATRKRRANIYLPGLRSRTLGRIQQQQLA